MERKNIVAGNWKMNKTLDEGIQLVREITHLVNEKVKNNDVGIILAPSFIHLQKVIENINEDKICVAGQNCSHKEEGAFTGEVSAKMLNSLNAKAVIIGHSERRAYFNENDEILKQKVDIALKNNLKVIFCCGEVLSERENHQHFEIIKNQIKNALFHLSKTEFEKIIIAYEPVWAIGTGKTASSEQAQEMHKFIRKNIMLYFDNEIAEKTTILYGGSCKPSNAKELFSKKDVDGGLIGGASLNAKDFIEIINAF